MKLSRNVKIWEDGRAVPTDVTAEKFDWWFADRAEADQARMVLELHGFTVYGPDHVPLE